MVKFSRSQGKNYRIVLSEHILFSFILCHFVADPACSAGIVSGVRQSAGIRVSDAEAQNQKIIANGRSSITTLFQADALTSSRKAVREAQSLPDDAAETFTPNRLRDTRRPSSFLADNKNNGENKPVISNNEHSITNVQNDGQLLAKDGDVSNNINNDKDGPNRTVIQSVLKSVVHHSMNEMVKKLVDALHDALGRVEPSYLETAHLDSRERFGKQLKTKTTKTNELLPKLPSLRVNEQPAEAGPVNETLLSGNDSLISEGSQNDLPLVVNGLISAPRDEESGDLKPSLEQLVSKFSQKSENDQKRIICDLLEQFSNNSSSGEAKEISLHDDPTVEAVFDALNAGALLSYDARLRKDDANDTESVEAIQTQPLTTNENQGAPSQSTNSNMVTASASEPKWPPPNPFFQNKSGNNFQQLQQFAGPTRPDASNPVNAFTLAQFQRLNGLFPANRHQLRMPIPVGPSQAPLLTPPQYQPAPASPFYSPYNQPPQVLNALPPGSASFPSPTGFGFSNGIPLQQRQVPVVVVQQPTGYFGTPAQLAQQQDLARQQWSIVPQSSISQPLIEFAAQQQQLQSQRQQQQQQTQQQQLRNNHLSNVQSANIAAQQFLQQMNNLSQQQQQQQANQPLIGYSQPSAVGPSPPSVVGNGYPNQGQHQRPFWGLNAQKPTAAQNAHTVPLFEKQPQPQPQQQPPLPMFGNQLQARPSPTEQAYINQIQQAQLAISGGNNPFSRNPWGPPPRQIVNSGPQYVNYNGQAQLMPPSNTANRPLPHVTEQQTEFLISQPRGHQQHQQPKQLPMEVSSGGPQNPLPFVNGQQQQQQTELQVNASADILKIILGSNNILPKRQTTTTLLTTTMIMTTRMPVMPPQTTERFSFAPRRQTTTTTTTAPEEPNEPPAGIPPFYPPKVDSIVQHLRHNLANKSVKPAEVLNGIANNTRRIDRLLNLTTHIGSQSQQKGADIDSIEPIPIGAIFGINDESNVPAEPNSLAQTAIIDSQTGHGNRAVLTEYGARGSSSHGESIEADPYGLLPEPINIGGVEEVPEQTNQDPYRIENQFPTTIRPPVVSTTADEFQEGSYPDLRQAVNLNSKNTAFQPADLQVSETLIRRESASTQVSARKVNEELLLKQKQSEFPPIAQTSTPSTSNSGVGHVTEVSIWDIFLNAEHINKMVPPLWKTTQRPYIEISNIAASATTTAAAQNLPVIPAIDIRTPENTHALVTQSLSTANGETKQTQAQSTIEQEKSPPLESSSTYPPLIIYDLSTTTKEEESFWQKHYTTTQRVPTKWLFGGPSILITGAPSDGSAISKDKKSLNFATKPASTLWQGSTRSSSSWTGGQTSPAGNFSPSSGSPDNANNNAGGADNANNSSNLFVQTVLIGCTAGFVVLCMICIALIMIFYRRNRKTASIPSGLNSSSSMPPLLARRLQDGSLDCRSDRTFFTISNDRLLESYFSVGDLRNAGHGPLGFKPGSNGSDSSSPGGSLGTQLPAPSSHNGNHSSFTSSQHSLHLPLPPPPPSLSASRNNLRHAHELTDTSILY